jgi:hypothetical protein
VDKLQEDNFRTFARQNPLMLPVNQEIADRRARLEAARKAVEEAKAERARQEVDGGTADEAVVAASEKDPEAGDPEIEEDTRRHREESELVDLKETWRKKIISEHLVYVRGTEIVFFEFLELIRELADRFRAQVDPTTGKFKVVLTKFIEDWLLKRLQSFVKFSIPTVKTKTDTARLWPESVKDVEIKAMLVEKQRLKKEQERLAAERALQDAELVLMRQEDIPALDLKEVEELRRKKME